MADLIRPCSVTSCERAHYGRGYCKLHMRRWQKYGDPTISRPPKQPQPSPAECAIDGCIQKARNVGLCGNHYNQKCTGRKPGPRAGMPPSMPGELWRSVPGTSGSYEVSNLGRVRSVPRITRGGQQRGGRIMALSTHPAGYRYVALYYDDKKRRRVVHQLVAEAFIGPRPDGLFVCHSDGDPSNNAATNLRYDTPGENIRDCVRHGRHFWANKTHCPQGHPYERYADLRYGRRYCSECHRLRCA